MSGFPDNPLWDFSLAVYARPGVAPACLALQDRHGLDVNLLLLSCWAGSRGHRVTADEWQRLRVSAGPWHEAVVKPLRAARRWLKTQQAAPRELAGPLRTAIKQRELEAERIEQHILAARVSVADGQGGPAEAARNLKAYLGQLGVTVDADSTGHLAALLAGCFDGLSPRDSLALLR